MRRRHAGRGRAQGTNSTPPQPPDPRIETDAAGLPALEIVDYLHETLGQQPTVFLSGLSCVARTGRDARPTAVTVTRLQICAFAQAYKIFRTSTEAFDRRTARTWFFGTNVNLDDEAPIAVLRRASGPPNSLRSWLPPGAWSASAANSFFGTFSLWPETPKLGLIHPVDVWAGLARLPDDSVTIRDESLGLRGRPHVAVGQAEDPDLRRRERVALGGATSDRVVLRQDDPVVLAGVSQPNLVGKKLRRLLSVDVGHREDLETSGSQPGEDAFSEAPIDEESQLIRFWCHVGRLSDAAPLLDGLGRGPRR